VEIIETPLQEKTKSAKEERKLIVDQDKVNNEIDPMAQYLSSHTQKVVRETVAKNHGEFQNKKTKVQAMRDAVVPPPKPKTMALPKDLFGSYKHSLAKSLEQQIQKNKGEAQAGADVSRTRDYLPGKEAGLETLLSTREFVYYTYYNRIRNQLSQYWEPKIKQKIVALFKQGRRIASTEDRITKVQIVLDSKGVLMKVQVMGASGVQDLDDIAVEAFRAAAPFPNPPKGIIEPDGTVKIQWDFVIES
jgi:protein TonB